MFFIIVMRGLCAKLVEFTRNLPGATSFCVSTSIWESLLSTKKLHFSSYFYVSLAWAFHTHDVKSMFLIILECFYHFWLCKRIRKHTFACQNTQQLQSQKYLKVATRRTPKVLPRKGGPLDSKYPRFQALCMYFQNII